MIPPQEMIDFLGVLSGQDKQGINRPIGKDHCPELYKKSVYRWRCKQ
jgi:hypothetical protein